MATETRIWQVSAEGALVLIQETSFAQHHVEADLEGWIKKNPEILGDDLLVIDCQRVIPGVGRLDLLCIDIDGRLVVVELKRDSTPREAVAQGLDYASWLSGASWEDIERNAEARLGRPLSEAFQEYFDATLPKPEEREGPRVILAAPGLDAAAERIVDYLARQYEVPINAVFFQYARLSGGEEILVRSILVPDEVAEMKKKRGTTSRVKLPDLLKMAKDQNVEPLLGTCRQMSQLWEEEPADVYGGSFVYWAEAGQGASRGGAAVHRRMVYGINVSGQEMAPPKGEIDVWIPVHKLEEATGIEEAAIRSSIEKCCPATSSKGGRLWIRLSASSQACALVEQLKAWASGPQAQSSVA